MERGSSSSWRKGRWELYERVGGEVYGWMQIKLMAHARMNSGMQAFAGRRAGRCFQAGEHLPSAPGERWVLYERVGEGASSSTWRSTSPQ